jgi:hypothetical protein
MKKANGTICLIIGILILVELYMCTARLSGYEPLRYNDICDNVDK